MGPIRISDPRKEVVRPVHRPASGLEPWPRQANSNLCLKMGKWKCWSLTQYLMVLWTLSAPLVWYPFSFTNSLNQLYGYYSHFFIIRNTLIIRKYTYYSHFLLFAFFWFWDFLSFLYLNEVLQAHNIRRLNAGGTVNYMQKDETCTSTVKRGMKFLTECVNGKLKVNGGSRF